MRFQVELNLRFAEFELNSDDEDRSSSDHTTRNTVNNGELLPSCCTSLLLKDLEEDGDSMDNASNVSACHSSSGSEAERQSVINGDQYTDAKDEQVDMRQIPSPIHAISAKTGAKKKTLSKKHTRPNTSTGFTATSGMLALAGRYSSISDETPRNCSVLRIRTKQNISPRSATQHRFYNSKSVIPGIYSDTVRNDPSYSDEQSSPPTNSPRLSPNFQTPVSSDPFQTPQTQHSVLRKSQSLETEWRCGNTTANSNKPMKKYVPLGSPQVVVATDLKSYERSKTFHGASLMSQNGSTRISVKLPPLETTNLGLTGAGAY